MKCLLKGSSKLDQLTIAEYFDVLARIDNHDGDGLATLTKRHNIRNPETNNGSSHPSLSN
ncbi:Glycine--tRNA ligase 1, mitochondrial [Madurella fahalii]|uniref:Glycine--tRNA ligase 1, mitochondrial n=1 Tax=Madurella fahalii TaxID=1157608 RepID=A0ABQ0GS50_9PEZI